MLKVEHPINGTVEARNMARIHTDSKPTAARDLQMLDSYRVASSTMNSPSSQPEA